MVATATEAKPLSAAEQKVLNDLLGRAQATAAPGVRVGTPYQALTNISLPRLNDPDKQTDLITAGNTVNLTDEEAARINRLHPVPVLRKVSDTTEAPRRITGRMLSGRLQVPATPPPGSDMPRPDPAGSTHIVLNVPEGQEPELGSENIDAVDILPRGARTE
ncbi:MAG TPA: hypothetical protein VGI66_00935 [Streptosporangiaceae bacterium]